jgi:hypothetical protein
MAATWYSTGTYCREFNRSRPRLIYELATGLLLYRTWPPGHVFNCHDQNLWRALDVEASTLPLSYASASGMAAVDSSWPLQEAIGIEVRPPDAPTDAEAPALSATAPTASPAPHRAVSEAALRDCILTIRAERPNSPPDEEELWKEVERRVDAAVSRDRIRQARDEVAPEFKLPPGRPRKSAQ